MDCRAMFSHLSEFVDGELAEELCREIRAHMADCQRCVAVLESLRATIDLCRSLPSPTPPEEVRRAVRALLEHEPPAD